MEVQEEWREFAIRICRVFVAFPDELTEVPKSALQVAPQMRILSFGEVGGIGPHLTFLFWLERLPCVGGDALFCALSSADHYFAAASAAS